jgi:hypothetical protein
LLVSGWVRHIALPWLESGELLEKPVISSREKDITYMAWRSGNNGDFGGEIIYPDLLLLIEQVAVQWMTVAGAIANNHVAGER